MKRKIQLCLMVFVVCQALCLGGSLSSAAPAPKDACLECHGPFDKLAATAPGYAAPSGEKITPHRFVPHDSKEVKAIPNCSNCHPSHSVPPNESERAALRKPEVDWCYSSCHHENTFKPCKECHPEKKK